MIPFAEYRPDVSDLKTNYSASVLNVLPRGDGYGPMPSINTLTGALPAACRGAFVARNTDGSVTLFGATSTRLYKLDNTTLTWTHVSKGSTDYSAVTSTDQWQFAQFNNYVIAVQANVVPQVYDLTSSSNFDDLSGSPPQARYIAIVNRFVVLSGLLADPYTIQWSDLDDPTQWTPGVGQSDLQQLPDGGIVRGVAGGEFGVVFQDSSIRRMTYAPGSSYYFQIERIAQDDGLYAPYSIIRAGDRIFFLSPQGFKVLLPGGYPTPIGKERVDRTFLADYDDTAPQLMIGAQDPKQTKVYWAYKSIEGVVGVFDKILCYDFVLERWTPIEQEGEYLVSLARPGLTIEGLDIVAPGSVSISGAANNGSGLIRLTVSSTSGWTTGDVKAVSGVGGTTEANGNWTITVINGTTVDLQGSTFTNAYTSGGIVGGSVDALTFSLDDLSTGSYPQISAFTTDHKAGLFSGSPLEATLETPEQSSSAGRRTLVRGLRVITDGADAAVSLGVRETATAARTYTTETTMNVLGIAPQRKSARYTRGKVRFPAGSEWTYAMGVEPDMVMVGVR